MHIQFQCVIGGGRWMGEGKNVECLCLGKCCGVALMIYSNYKMLSAEARNNIDDAMVKHGIV